MIRSDYVIAFIILLGIIVLVVTPILLFTGPTKEKFENSKRVNYVS